MKTMPTMMRDGRKTDLHHNKWDANELWSADRRRWLVRCVCGQPDTLRLQQLIRNLGWEWGGELVGVLNLRLWHKQKKKAAQKRSVSSEELLLNGDIKWQKYSTDSLDLKGLVLLSTDTLSGLYEGLKHGDRKEPGTVTSWMRTHGKTGENNVIDYLLHTIPSCREIPF